MKIKNSKGLLAIIVILAAWLGVACADELTPIKLPPPKIDPSKSLVQALTDRKTSREFSEGEIPLQTLSNLLWAAFGISRPDSGKRTAPSAYNRQEIDIYVAIAKGCYLYDAKSNSLTPVAAGDVRSMTGTQSFIKDAAVELVYVADFARMQDADEAEKVRLSAAGSGFIGQNVYLYCAAEGLATVFRAGINREKLAELMKLRPEQRITFAQTVGKSKVKKTE